MEQFQARLRAAGPPPSSDYLFDPGLLQRLTSDPDVVIEYDSDADAEPVPVKRRQRRPDLIKQVRRAIAAGLTVTSASVTADGVVITFGEPPSPADGTIIETADELRKLI